MRAVRMVTDQNAKREPATVPHVTMKGSYSAVDCQKVCKAAPLCKAFVLFVDGSVGHCYMFNTKATTLPVAAGGTMSGATFGYPADCDDALALQSFSQTSRSDDGGFDSLA